MVKIGKMSQAQILVGSVTALIIVASFVVFLVHLVNSPPTPPEILGAIYRTDDAVVIPMNNIQVLSCNKASVLEKGSCWVCSIRSDIIPFQGILFPSGSGGKLLNQDMNIVVCKEKEMECHFKKDLYGMSAIMDSSNREEFENYRDGGRCMSLISLSLY